MSSESAGCFLHRKLRIVRAETTTAGFQKKSACARLTAVGFLFNWIIGWDFFFVSALLCRPRARIFSLHTGDRPRVRHSHRSRAAAFHGLGLSGGAAMSAAVAGIARPVLVHTPRGAGRGCGVHVVLLLLLLYHLSKYHMRAFAFFSGCLVAMRTHGDQ